MAAVTGLLVDRVGEILTSTFDCACGASFTARRRVVLDTRNPALNTCLDLDFDTTRAFMREHRPHGRVKQRTDDQASRQPAA